MPQLATPPPDSPVKVANGAADSNVSLSPFASLLLKHTDVSFSRKSLCHLCLRTRLTKAENGIPAPERPRKPSTPARQAVPPPQAQTVSSSQVSTPNGTAHAHNAYIPYSSSALSEPPSTPARPGPAVVINSKSVQRGDYQRYDSIDTPDSLSLLPYDPMNGRLHIVRSRSYARLSTDCSRTRKTWTALTISSPCPRLMATAPC
jgi:cohesin loading factor subunit SCC2